MDAPHQQQVRMRLWCVHGNLQQPDVWSPFEGRLFQPGAQGPSRAAALHCELVDLYTTAARDFRQWATLFCETVRRRSAGVSQLLMGYSLGGRLALHAALEAPELWRAVVAIGAHVGLPDAQERRARLLLDQSWGDRFLSEPLEPLLAEWDGQGVFGGAPNRAPRQLERRDRKAIRRLFDTFSTGRQEFLLPRLARLTRPPVLFVSGAADAKYCRLGRELATKCPTVSHAIVPRAGHRAPWENPTDFVTITQRFFDQQAP